MGRKFFSLALTACVLFFCACGAAGTERGDASGRREAEEIVSCDGAGAESSLCMSARYGNSTNFYGVFNTAAEHRGNVESRKEGILQYDRNGRRLQEIELEGINEIYYVDDQWIYCDSQNRNVLCRIPLRKENGCDKVQIDKKEKLLSANLLEVLLYVGEEYLVYFDMDGCFRYDFASGEKVKVKGNVDDDHYIYGLDGLLVTSDKSFYFDTERQELARLNIKENEKTQMAAWDGNYAYYISYGKDQCDLCRCDRRTGETEVVLTEAEAAEILQTKKGESCMIRGASVSEGKVFVNAIFYKEGKGEQNYAEKLIWRDMSKEDSWHYEESLYQFMSENYTQGLENEYGKALTGELGIVRYPYVMISNVISIEHWAMAPYLCYNLETKEGVAYTGNDGWYDYF